MCIIYCYLIIRNAEASLVEIESRDQHYKRILLFLRAPQVQLFLFYFIYYKVSYIKYRNIHNVNSVSK